MALSVNISVRQLEDSGFVDAVLGTLARYGLDPAVLVLEVTETLLVDTADARSKLDALRSRGVRVAVDDFGTGYSSLSYLRSLPLDILKIDQSFTAGLVQPSPSETPGGNQDRAVTAAIIGLARTLGLDVIAEGVEAHEQLTELRALGCELGQGFLLGRPSTASTSGSA